LSEHGAWMLAGVMAVPAARAGRDGGGGSMSVPVAVSHRTGSTLGLQQPHTRAPALLPVSATPFPPGRVSSPRDSADTDETYTSPRWHCSTSRESAAILKCSQPDITTHGNRQCAWCHQTMVPAMSSYYAIASRILH
jgi:hypothetical protein